MRNRLTKLVLAVAFSALISGCGGRAAIQADQPIFTLDNNFQRHDYAFPIEETFDRTVRVFREAGYKLDVVDRATGQISGRRGPAAEKGGTQDRNLKFFALVLPGVGNGSELRLKIIQIIDNGGIPLVGSSKAEIMVTEPQMYQYVFRRLEDRVSQPQLQSSLPAPELPPVGEANPL